ncbi:alpha-keto acid decarboxylase family protein [Holzapfeliella sp. JNUCC 72]
MYTLSDYLLDVTKYLGSDEVFGVPGDFNLQFLDHITHRDDMKWIGNANELNASYMADGYARERGFATFVTTFGVGELSAINGLAGSTAEQVPVLEIVGAPTTKVQHNGGLVHHTFADGQFKRFIKAHEALGLKTTFLTKDNAINQINDTLHYIYENKKPAYIVLPTDLVALPVNESLKAGIPSLFESAQTDVSQSVEAVTSAIKAAKKPVIIVGHEAQRFNLGDAIEGFSKQNNIPVATLAMGKSTVNEEFENFVGTYNGSISDESINRFVDEADAVITIGAKLTDSITGGFTQSFGPEKTISLNFDDATVYGRKLTTPYNFEDVINHLASTNLNQSYDKVVRPELAKDELKATDNKLTQEFYDRALEKFVQSNNTLVAEQGTSFFGLASQQLKADTNFIGQPLWGSIGYAFPSALGSQFANQNDNRRTVLSTGEGSLLLTIQDFGVAFKENLTPVIFIIENSGYTVERVIHGETEPYNDVPKLDYSTISKAFGAKDDQYLFINVDTEKDLVNAMQTANENPDKMIVVQANMGIMDAPEQLMKTGKLFEAQNH